jgi:hypothetical protein
LCKARHDRGYSAFNVRSINFVCVKNTQVVTPGPRWSAENTYKYSVAFEARSNQFCEPGITNEAKSLIRGD